MHVGNVEWLRDLDARYDLGDARLLELGALDINGSARDHLHARSWIGIDQTPGEAVDIVCKATETAFEPLAFDVILCTSMLEHDPNWRESLSHNLQWLKPNGLLFLSWGAEGNTHHLPEPWAFVPVADVERWSRDAGLDVLESTWERDRYTGDCAGCYDMVLRKPGPWGYEAPVGHRVLVGPDPDGQGGSFGVAMGDKVRIVSTNQVGTLIRRRLGSHDDRVVVLVDGAAVETQARDVMPWEGD